MAIPKEFSPILHIGNLLPCTLGGDSEDACANQCQPTTADTNGNEQDPNNQHAHCKLEVAHLLVQATTRVARLPPGQSMSAASQYGLSKHHSLHGPLHNAVCYEPHERSLGNIGNILDSFVQAYRDIGHIFCQTLKSTSHRFAHGQERAQRN